MLALNAVVAAFVLCTLTSAMASASAVRGLHGSMEVECHRGHKLCLLCSGEAHSPAPCAEVEKWNDNEFELLDAQTHKFMMTRFKRCPACKVYVERNKGCASEAA